MRPMRGPGAWRFRRAHERGPEAMLRMANDFVNRVNRKQMATPEFTSEELELLAAVVEDTRERVRAQFVIYDLGTHEVNVLLKSIQEKLQAAEG